MSVLFPDIVGILTKMKDASLNIPVNGEPYLKSSLEARLTANGYIRPLSWRGDRTSWHDKICAVVSVPESEVPWWLE